MLAATVHALQDLLTLHSMKPPEHDQGSHCSGAHAAQGLAGLSCFCTGCWPALVMTVASLPVAQTQAPDYAGLAHLRPEKKDHVVEELTPS